MFWGQGRSHLFALRMLLLLMGSAMALNTHRHACMHATMMGRMWRHLSALEMLLLLMSSAMASKWPCMLLPLHDTSCSALDTCTAGPD